MADIHYIASVVSATILSTKTSVTVEQCNRDYKELEGKWIPYKEFGFKTLEHFFENLPGFNLVRLANGSCIVEAKKTGDIKHITDLVSKQKGSKHIPKPVRNIRSGNSWKPASSWSFNKSPYKVSSMYKTPDVHHKVSNKYGSKPFKISPPVHREISTKGLQKPNSQYIQLSGKKLPNSQGVQPNPQKPAVAQNVEPAAPKRAANVIPNNTVKQENVTVSKLSGIKPGDILSRSNSNTLGNSAGNSENKKERSSVQSVNNGRTSAANRLTALQNTLQTSVVKNDCPKNNIDIKESMPDEKPKPLIKQESLNSLLNGLPDAKSRLEKCCEVMELPRPVYKTVPMKQKRDTIYDCTVKIGNMYAFTTYPNSHPTEDKATEAASLIGVNELRKIITEKTYPVSELAVAIDRAVQIVSMHPSGLWAKTLPDIYKDQYKEHLPDSWMELLDHCPEITKDIGMNGIMLLPIPKSPTSTLQPDLIGTSKASAGPPALQFPEGVLWNVYVMSASSTVEIWLRIIGEDYSEAYETLITKMEEYYLEHSQPIEEIVEGGWYALNSEDSWLRARVLEIDFQNDTALCFLVDSGHEEYYPFEVFYDLPTQFLSLPPQAILCCLAGLEEYALFGETSHEKTFLSKTLSDKVFVAEVLHMPADKQEDPSITVVLFDTSTDVDVNINKELLKKLSEKATSPVLPPGVSEVYVMDVTVSGTICVQIHNDSWKLLQNMLHQISSGPFPIESLQASFGDIVPSPRQHYLVKSLSGEWRRGILRSGVVDQLGEKCVAVRYIDCGRAESVPIKNLVMLERISDALNNFPAQVLYLNLHNVGTLSAEQMEKINRLVPRNTPVLCKQIASGSSTVELFVRTQPHGVLCGVNNALILEKELSDKLKINNTSIIDPLASFAKKKQRLLAMNNSSVPANSVSLKKDKAIKIIPEIGQYFDVLICMASNPRNFVVQPLQHLQKLTDLMLEMQSVCEKLQPPSGPLSPSKLYAAYHTRDKQWYRAKVFATALKDSPSMHFIDYGDYYTTTMDNIRELPNEFATLPAMAMKAKLYGVRPKDQDWSVDDCVRFIELVNEQSFASIVKDIEEDPINEGELIFVLDLVDTSTKEDLYVNVLLVKENRAVPYP